VFAHPLFKVFGSKWSATRAGRYPEPGSERIFEPFAGGAGYSLNYCDHQVTIWESNAQLVQLWSWIINCADSNDVLSIPIDYPEGYDIRTSGLSLGQGLLIKHWQRTNNVGECWTISSWGNKSGQWTANTRARVAEEIHAVKHWKLEPIDYTEAGTYFIDPPYQYNYKYRSDPIDYEDLAKKSLSIPSGRVIACEAVCPKTGAVPNYFAFLPNHSQVTSRRKSTNNHHSKELLAIYRPGFGTP
jgi:hypothetical protein